MSNAAVITLQKKKIGLHRVWLDDNFGEAIHVHVDDFRADLSNQEFAQMYSDLCDALNELLRVPGFDCHKINPVYMELLLWKDLDLSLIHILRFTCIVPVYNVAPYLETCVVSLLHQKEMED